MAGFQLPWLPEWAIARNRAAAVGYAFTGESANPANFPPEVVESYREAAARPGAARAMVNWYRGFARWPLGLERVDTQVPTMLLWGEQDSFLRLELTERTDELVKDFTLRRIPEASHWVQQDAPELVNALLLPFLADQPVPTVDEARATLG